ncbi:ly6/PLAUR domain-containing protein 3-like [Lissotriton helveticus]
MEEGKHAQVFGKVALAGMLAAVLLAEGVASLRCYSCKDFNDGGCAVDRIKIEECTPPQNVCLEAIGVRIIDKQKVSAAIKGCDIGVHQNQDNADISSEYSYSKRKVHACSEDLCNTLVTEAFVNKTLSVQHENRTQDLSNLECYSCVSTSKDQCSPHNAPVVRCLDESPSCFEGNGSIILGKENRVILPYFMKKCAVWSCTTWYMGVSDYENVSESSSCCSKNLCNGLVPTITPKKNGGLRTTYVSSLIVAALVAIISLYRAAESIKYLIQKLHYHSLKEDEPFLL